MKVVLKISLVFMSIFVFYTGAAVAQTSTDASWYAGVNVGQMVVSVDGLDNGTNGGVLVGYQFQNGFAIEAEYTAALAAGDATILGMTGDWDVKTFAVYGAFRSSGPLYFKGKLGYLNEDVSINIPGIASADGSDSGLSLGVGLGWRVVDAANLEFEYTLVEQDIDYFSLGCNFHF